MKSLLTGIRHYFPAAMHIDGREKSRSILGAMLGILITGMAGQLIIGTGTTQPWLLASMGASAVLLFATPASPLAQPWAMVGGNLLSATIGVTCAKLIGNPLMAASIAVALAIAVMFALRCLHPPGGAVALGSALGGQAMAGASYWSALSPIGLNSLFLLFAAIAYNNLCGRRYPHVNIDHGNRHGTADAAPTERLGATAADLDAVLEKYNQVLDVSRDDLEEIMLQAEIHAYQRRFGDVTCREIMSGDVIKVEFGTALQEAWRLMRVHKIKALPVVNRFNRVIGLLTMDDFAKQLDLDVIDSLSERLRRLLKPTQHSHSEKPEVVGQIMTTTVQTASVDLSILSLEPLFSNSGLHHLPIVDSNGRLVGIVTQSDMVAALYRSQVKSDLPVSTSASARVAKLPA